MVSEQRFYLLLNLNTEEVAELGYESGLPDSKDLSTL